MLESMEEMVFGLEPSRIFINIGTNDIADPGYRLEKLIENYREILRRIREGLPEAETNVLAFYPVNDIFNK